MDDVAHKAMIDIDESGSVYVEHEESHEEPIEFFCDRPFAYIIYDSIAKRVLMFGIYRGNHIDVKIKQKKAKKKQKQQAKKNNYHAHMKKKEAEAEAAKEPEEAKETEAAA